MRSIVDTMPLNKKIGRHDSCQSTVTTDGHRLESSASPDIFRAGAAKHSTLGNVNSSVATRKVPFRAAKVQHSLNVLQNWPFLCLQLPCYRQYLNFHHESFRSFRYRWILLPWLIDTLYSTFFEWEHTMGSAMDSAAVLLVRFHF